MKLLEPLKIGQVEAKNRMVLPPMATDFAVEGVHEVTGRYLTYMEARARGGAGLLINEYVAVSPGGRASPRQLGLWDDWFIPGMRKLVDMVHEYDAPIIVQLHHAGRETSADITGDLPVAASAIPSPRKGGRVRALDRDELPGLVEDFARAAVRAQAAGFDGVELHGAHGYLLASFMSPHGNQRTDAYGGGFEGYLRFPLEVIAGVRQAVGPDYPIGFRISGDEFVDEGRTLPETVDMARCLAEAGLDYLHVSAGASASLHTIIAPGAYPLGWNVNAARAVKQAVDIPVIAVGRIHDPELAEEIVATGKADMVALGRALLADPDFPRKVKAGRQEEIRPCLGCMGGCNEEPVACTQNPRLGLNLPAGEEKAVRPKRVLVVGGGVGGLEAARVAAQRGHQVTLYEEQSELGGQVKLATRPPKKQRLYEAVRWRQWGAEKHGVEIKTGVRVDAGLVQAHGADAVIIATGAEPRLEQLVGNDLPTFTYAQVLEGAPGGERVGVVGGGMLGLETAEFLAASGKQVVVLEATAQLGADVPASALTPLLGRLEEAGVETVTEVSCLRRLDGQLQAQRGEEVCCWPVDAVVTAYDRQPVDGLAKDCETLVPELYVIGDAKEPRRLRQAIAEGDELARQL